MRTAQPGLAVLFGPRCRGTTSAGGNPRETECSLTLAERLGLSNPNVLPDLSRTMGLPSPANRRKEIAGNADPLRPAAWRQVQPCWVRERAASSACLISGNVMRFWQSTIEWLPRMFGLATWHGPFGPKGTEYAVSHPERLPLIKGWWL